MDAPSRSYYRGRVAMLAKNLRVAETVVAENALYLCEGRQDYLSHVGYYICDEGEAELKSQLRPDKKLYRLSEGQKLAAFVALQVLLTALIITWAWQSTWTLLLIFAAWAIANTLAIRIFLRFSQRSFIPRISVNDGGGVLVAIPVLLADKKNLENAVLQMETHYLANPLPGACFAAIGDFKDSKDGGLSEKEEALLNAARDETARLNKKYAQGEDIFYFLIRERSFHEADGIYMGRERKRGALEDLMRLLSNGDDSPFLLRSGELPHEEYVLTLDEDTILPLEALQSFVGAVRHPLNRPVRDKAGRIERGYGIIFPVMRNTASGAAQSAFVRIAAGDPGVESYRCCVSEFYMDVFGSGIFGGKGVWEIKSYLDISEEIPQNAVLCHDLLEGSRARAALMGDVALYDAEPSNCQAWWKRLHRWIRGDWQLIPFIMAARPLSKYQMIENLRRSFQPCASLAVIFALTFMSWRFAFVAVLFIFFDPLIDLLGILFSRGGDKKGLLAEREPLIRRAILDLMLLPYAAWKSADAIIRTLYRLSFSHRHMLEWQTAAQQSGGGVKGAGSYFNIYAICPLAGVALLLVAGFEPLCMIFAIMWIFAPFCLRGLDQKSKRPALAQAQRSFLMDIALRTWQFFERYASEKTSYLPPDNVQESPAKPPVMRTSPTNIGMAALAAVAAHDLGFIDTATLHMRLSKMAGALEKLDKWHGHLYNWYDLNTMLPCEPAYVSSVDSGNFVCAMFAASEAVMAAKQESLAQRLRALALCADFTYLYDDRSRLFYIGYDSRSGSLSPSRYDLLASEARLLSFAAIAMNQVEKRHWYSLGRLLNTERVLVSWSGTMFEYLLPVLFTGMVPGTLLQKSCVGAVQTQIAKAGKSKIWGVSESAYYAFDRRMYYQYAPFGIRALSLCDKDEEDVIAPYATLLALCCAPLKAVKNLMKLKEIGALGEYGMFEAVDMEASRTGGEAKIIKSYMAHHQGMGICAIADLLRDGSVRRRFMQTPEMRAARLLLEEKMPLSVPIKPLKRNEKREESKELPPRAGKQAAFPETQLLSNGQYLSFISEGGGGFSRCGKTMLTRWRPSLGEEDFENGLRVYISSQDSVWEICGLGENASSRFLPYEVCFEKNEGELGAMMRICVSAQHNGEVRDIKIANHGKTNKSLSLGVFFEPCLASQAQDMAHPAFQKLRIDAESEENVLLFARRNAPGEEGAWLYCLLEGAKLRFCTDRLVSPGRGKTQLEAMREPLPDTQLASPIEPVCHIRAEFSLEGGDAQNFRLVLGFARDRSTAMHDAFALREENPWEYARAQAKSNLYFAGLERGKADLFERMAARLLLREATKTRLPLASGGVAALWALGISGDLPIVLLRCGIWNHLRTAKLLAAFVAYMEARGEECDAVIIGEYPREYRNELREELEKLCSAHVHLLHAYDLSSNSAAMLQAACMLEMDAQTLETRFAPVPGEGRSEKNAELAADKTRRDDFAVRKPAGISGENGFDLADHSYVMLLQAGAHTPLPWCNIICNDSFGTLLSERGGGYTWGENSRLKKLTPWHNDPVADAQTEQLIFTDCESKERWNPLRDEAPLCVRHGFGYSSFISGARALYMRMNVFVDASMPLKYTWLELENPLMRERSLKLQYEVAWRLGDLPHNEAVLSEYSNGVLRVYNVREEQRGYMALSGAQECEADCGIARSRCSLRASLKLAAGEKKVLLLLLGGGEAPGELPRAEQAKAAFTLAKAKWEDRLDVLKLSTGELSLDAMLNEWLPYQVLSSRIMARTAYYQCGGAIGFRDQLQDAMSLKLIDPERLRKQILLCASKQFEAGDVLHWWHPGEEFVIGVRTHIRDDRLFLPYALLEYLELSGDMPILKTEISYLEDMPISAEQKDVYANMYDSGIKASLYAHCRAAIESMDFGAHGLCLMGGGDWNDAMDKLGEGGGESVWLSFFLLHILERFTDLAIKNDDRAFAEKCRKRAVLLREACEREWDGAWYRRAYFADGAALGTRDGESCAIDCITQAWAAICGATHAEEAFDSMAAMLLDEEAGILKLLSPPFSPSEGHEAGYIQAYLPGVRENGGQYTHGACWAVMGACALGKYAMAEKLFKMLLPVSHTATPQGQQRYKAEPYVAAGDVYALSHAGRAGWTWYTGAAGWLYAIGTEYIFGIKRRGDLLIVAPITGKESFSFRYRFKSALYEVRVTGTQKKGRIKLKDDGKTHRIVIE